MAKLRARLTDDNDPLSSTESVFASLEQVSKSASQQDSNTAIQQAAVRDSRQRVNKLDSKLVNLSASQKVTEVVTSKPDKSAIRKSTFQLSEEILKQLDRYHLQLQLELGKSEAPYKEVIVEEAIAQFLAKADPTDTKALRNLKTRQETR